MQFHSIISVHFLLISWAIAAGPPRPSVTITRFDGGPTGTFSTGIRTHSISAICDDHGGSGAIGNGRGGKDDDNGPDHSGRGSPSRCLNATATITAASCAASDTACSSCGLAYAKIDACDHLGPRAPQLGLRAPTDIAAMCLCYNAPGDNNATLTWAPNLFDAPYSLCPQWASTGDPAHLRDYSTGVNYCNRMGNIMNATIMDMASTSAGAPATTTVSGGAGGGGAVVTGTGIITGTSGAPSASLVGSNLAAGSFDAKSSAIFAGLCISVVFVFFL